MNRAELQAMLIFVRGLDVGTNPEPAALFDPLISGFNVWCIPSDHPEGLEWNHVAKEMDAGAFAKRCEYVGCAFYYWQEGHIEISTDAYALQDHFPQKYGYKNSTIHNRPEDLKWLRSKVEWVFEQLNIECPTIVIGHDK